MEDDTFSGSDFESAASATASPATGTAETVQPSSDPTAQPAASATPETAATGQAAAAPTVSETTKGPIPFEVHHTALANARQKAIDEYRQQHGWAETVDRAAVEEFARLGELYQRDRPAYIRQILAEAQTDPELAPIVRSIAGGVLGARTPQPPSFEPDIPVYDDRGQLVAQTFSAQKVQDLVKHAVAEALGKEVTPIKERFAEADRRQAHREQLQQLDAEADRVTAVVSKLPHFKEHEPAIAEAIGQMPEGIDYREAGLLAYINVVLPQLSTTERKKVLADLNQKPGASTVSPSGGTTAVPKADAEKDWTELLAEEAARLGV